MHIKILGVHSGAPEGLTIYVPLVTPDVSSDMDIVLDISMRK
jgi:hypothetical protein